MTTVPPPPLDAPALRRATLAEWLLLVVLVATALRDVGDPIRLLAWVFGHLPERRHASLHPWLSLVLGTGNALLLASLLLIGRAGRVAEAVRTAALAFFVTVLLFVPALREVEVRFHVDEVPGNTAAFRSQSHDGGVLQTEMAVRALFRGRNPYRERYDAPPMSRSPDSDEAGWASLGYAHNPAYDHLPYMPGVLVATAPVQWLCEHTFGRYDVRLVYLACALAMAWALGRLVPRGPPRRMVWALALLDPLLKPYITVGRNDAMLLLPLALFGAYVIQRRHRAASIALGAALAIKQFALLALPFLFILAYVHEGRDARRAARTIWPALAIPLALTLPFLLWDPRAVIDDVLLWNLGIGPDPYPLKWAGWGLSVLSYGLGLVDRPAGPNPFGWVALPAQLAALVLASRALLKRPSPRSALLGTAVVLYVALFTSRAFAFNYAVVPATLVALAWLAPGEAPAATRTDAPPPAGTG